MNKLILSVVILCLASCASMPPLSQNNSSANEFAGLQAGQRVLVAPVLGGELRDVVAQQQLSEDVVHNLRAAGLVSERLSVQAYRQLWLESTLAHGGILTAHTAYLDLPKYQAAMQTFIAALGRDYEFDVVVFPAFAERSLRLNKGLIAWDGVRQMSNIKASFESLSDAKLSGTTRALSIELTLYDSAGRWVSNTYGGVALMYDIDLTQSPPRLVARKGSLYSGDELVQAVGLALTPLLQNRESKLLPASQRVAESGLR